MSKDPSDLNEASKTIASLRAVNKMLEDRLKTGKAGSVELNTTAKLEEEISELRHRLKITQGQLEQSLLFDVKWQNELIAKEDALTQLAAVKEQLTQLATVKEDALTQLAAVKEQLQTALKERDDLVVANASLKADAQYQDQNRSLQSEVGSDEKMKKELEMLRKELMNKEKALAQHREDLEEAREKLEKTSSTGNSISPAKSPAPFSLSSTSSRQGDRAVEEKKALEEKLRNQVNANKDLQAELLMVKAGMETLKRELQDSQKSSGDESGGGGGGAPKKDLEVKMQQLHTVNKLLEDRLIKERAELKKLEERISQLQEVNKGLEERLQAERRETEKTKQLVMQKEQLHLEALENGERSLQKLQTEMSRLRDEKAQASSLADDERVKKLETDLREAETRYQELASKETKLQQVNRLMQESVKALRADKETNATVLQKLQAELVKGEAARESLEDQLAEAQDALKASSEREAKLQDINVTLMKGKTEAELKLGEAGADLARVSEEATALKQRVQVLEGEGRAAVEWSERAKGVLATSKARISLLEEQLAAKATATANNMDAEKAADKERKLVQVNTLLEDRVRSLLDKNKELSGALQESQAAAASVKPGAELEEELVRVRAALEQSKSALAESEIVIQAAADKERKLIQVNSMLEDRIRSLNDKNRELSAGEGQLAAAQRRAEEAEKRAQAAQEEVDRIKGDSDAHAKQGAASVEEIKKELADASDKAAKLEELNRTLMARVRSMSEAAKALESKLADQSKVLENELQEKAELVRKVAQLNQDNVVLQGELTEARASKAQAIEKEVESLRAELAARNREVRVEPVVAPATEKDAELAAKLKEANRALLEKLRQAKAELATAKDQLETAQHDVAKATAARDQGEQERKDAKKREHELQVERDTLQRALKEAKEDAERQQAAVVATAGAADGATHQVSSLQSLNKMLQERLKAAQEQEQKERQRADESAQRVVELEAALAEVQQRRQEQQQQQPVVAVAKAVEVSSSSEQVSSGRPNLDEDAQLAWLQDESNLKALLESPIKVDSAGVAKSRGVAVVAAVAEDNKEDLLLKEARAQIAELEQQLAVVSHKADLSHTQLQKEVALALSAQAMTKTARERVVQLEESVQIAEAKSEALQKELDAAVLHAKEQDRKIESLQELNKRFSETIKELKAHQQGQAGHAELEGRLRERDAEVQALQTKASDELEAAQRTADNLKAVNTALQTRMRDLDAELKAAQAELAKKSEEVTQLDDDLRDTAASLREAYDAKDAAEKQASDTRAELDAVRASISKEIIDDLSDTAASLREAHDGKEAAEKEASDARAERDAVRASLTEELRDAAASLREAHDAKEVAEKEASDARAERDAVRASLTEELRDAAASLRKAHDAKEAAEKEASDARAERDAVRASLTKEVRDTAASLRAAHQEKEKSAAKLAQVSGELDVAERDLIKLQNEYDALVVAQGAAVEARKEASDLRQTISRQEAEIGKLRSELEVTRVAHQAAAKTAVLDEDVAKLKADLREEKRRNLKLQGDLADAVSALKTQEQIAAESQERIREVRKGSVLERRGAIEAQQPAVSLAEAKTAVAALRALMARQEGLRNQLWGGSSAVLDQREMISLLDQQTEETHALISKLQVIVGDDSKVDRVVARARNADASSVTRQAPPPTTGNSSTGVEVLKLEMLKVQQELATQKGRADELHSQLLVATQQLEKAKRHAAVEKEIREGSDTRVKEVEKRLGELERELSLSKAKASSLAHERAALLEEREKEAAATRSATADNPKSSKFVAPKKPAKDFSDVDGDYFAAVPARQVLVEHDALEGAAAPPPRVSKGDDEATAQLVRERDEARSDTSAALDAVSQWEQRYAGLRQELTQAVAQRDQARRDTATALDAVSQWEQRHAGIKEELSQAVAQREQARKDTAVALGAVSEWEMRYAAVAETEKRSREQKTRDVSLLSPAAAALSSPPSGLLPNLRQTSVTATLCCLISLDGRQPHVNMGRGGAVSFGREATSTVKMDARDISHRHARVFYDPDLHEEGIRDDGLTPFVLEDLSSNGVFVNMNKVGKGARHRLRHGDMVWFSKLSVKQKPISSAYSYVFYVAGLLATRKTLSVPLATVAALPPAAENDDQGGDTMVISPGRGIQ